MSKIENRRRIALALEYPLMQQGGTEVLVQALVRGLSRHFEIVLVSGDKSREELPAEYSKLIASHLSWTMGPPGAAPARALTESLRGQGVELAHFHFGGTFVWASNRYWRCPVYYFARTGVPCLSTNHLATEWLNCGVNPNRPGWVKHLFQLFAIFSKARLYRRLKFEVCVSKGDRERVARMFPMFRNKIIQRYHSLLSAQTPPPDLGQREPVVLCVGTIGGRKAQWNLAEAFARVADRHPQWRLEFVGRTEIGPDAERVRTCAARSGLESRIRLLGRLSDEETLSRMKRASIFCLPSLQEGLGLSLQEALFHGCVAVGSRAGGIPELIDEGVNGLLVPAGDVAALSAALERLMTDAALLEKLRMESRPSVLRKGMTVEAMVRSYVDLYGKCLAERP